MSSKKKQTNEQKFKEKYYLNKDKLKISDVICSVCQSILNQPVVLTCNHIFCLSCFNKVVENNQLICPCCRLRFGSWLRNASRNNKVVDNTLWDIIKEKFADNIRKETGNSSKPIFSPPSVKISNPGEIQKEYETELKRHVNEIQKEVDKELIQSSEFIVNLYKKEKEMLMKSEEEPTQKPQQQPEEDDEEVFETPTNSPNTTIQSFPVAGPSHSTHNSNNSNATITSRETLSKSNESSSSSKYNLIKTFADHLNRGTELLKTTVHKAIEPLIVKPSKIHRSTSNLSDDGEDSLKSEMCHFKPIRTVPTTPKASLKSVNFNVQSPKAKSGSTSSFSYNFSPKTSSFRLTNGFRSAFTSVSTNIHETKVELKRRSTEKDNLSKTPKIRKIEKKKNNGNVYDPNLNIVETNNENFISDLINEQTKREKMILQEKQDYEYAKKLQQEMNSTQISDRKITVDRSRKKTLRNTKSSEFQLPVRRSTRFVK